VITTKKLRRLSKGTRRGIVPPPRGKKGGRGGTGNLGGIVGKVERGFKNGRTVRADGLVRRISKGAVLVEKKGGDGGIEEDGANEGGGQQKKHRIRGAILERIWGLPSSVTKVENKGMGGDMRSLWATWGRKGLEAKKQMFGDCENSLLVRNTKSLKLDGKRERNRGRAERVNLLPYQKN